MDTGKARRLRQHDDVTIFARALAVYDEKIRNAFQRQQGVMPDTGGIVHSLIALAQEGTQIVRSRRAAARRDDHQVGVVR